MLEFEGLIKQRAWLFSSSYRNYVPTVIDIKGGIDMFVLLDFSFFFFSVYAVIIVANIKSGSDFE